MDSSRINDALIAIFKHRGVNLVGDPNVPPSIPSIAIQTHDDDRHLHTILVKQLAEEIAAKLAD